VILVAGEALIDLLVSADGAITAVPGGGPFNVARALARLGARRAFGTCRATASAGNCARPRLPTA
jgi:sugar/nucleoside kinase (ribokinase family)